jgi:ABC-type branched-subunit amino acid transport system substrate-binding protein
MSPAPDPAFITFFGVIMLVCFALIAFATVYKGIAASPRMERFKRFKRLFKGKKQPQEPPKWITPPGATASQVTQAALEQAPDLFARARAAEEARRRYEAQHASKPESSEGSE